MFSFLSSKCSNLSLILYDNHFILTIVELCSDLSNIALANVLSLKEKIFFW